MTLLVFVWQTYEVELYFETKRIWRKTQVKPKTYSLKYISIPITFLLLLNVG